MEILYLYSKETGDEIAIRAALESLGHKVLFHKDSRDDWHRLNCDLVLFHHSNQISRICNLSMPKVCWCFDLVVGAKEYLGNHVSAQINREGWVHNLMDVVDLGCFTDGEVVEKYPDKAIRLLQGPWDIYRGRPTGRTGDLLFAGMVPPPRQPFIELIESRFPNRLTKLARRRDWVHGTGFADLIAGHKIVIAPDVPIKSNYWSNRVYMVSGYGGFLLHPYIEELAQQYTDGEEIVFYMSREDLLEKIEYYLDPSNDQERRYIADNALARTRAEHTYTHRVKQLMGVVEERLLTNNRSEP